MKASAKLTILGACALICSAAAITYVVSANHMRATTPEEAKEVIKARFFADQQGFDFAGASELLSQSRVENAYAVCSTGAEATPDQYVDLSRAIDTLGKKSPGIRLAMNAALKGDGVSDCDYRVMETLTYALSKSVLAAQRTSSTSSSSSASSGANL